MARASLSTSFIKTLGKTLCLGLAALTHGFDLGDYAGIFELGSHVVLALGGYMIGMWRYAPHHHQGRRHVGQFAA
jgi:urea transport system permease protein